MYEFAAALVYHVNDRNTVHYLIYPTDITAAVLNGKHGVWGTKSPNLKNKTI
jgi:hypothetical protein